MNSTQFTNDQLKLMISIRLGAFSSSTKPRVETNQSMDVVNVYDLPFFLKYSNVILGVPIHIRFSKDENLKITVFPPDSEYEVRLMFWNILNRLFNRDNKVMNELILSVPSEWVDNETPDRILVNAIDYLQSIINEKSSGHYGMMVEIKLFQ